MKTPARPLSLIAALTLLLSIPVTIFARETPDKSTPPAAADQPAAPASEATPAPAPDVASTSAPAAAPAAAEEPAELRRLDAPTEEKAESADDADKPDEAAQPAEPDHSPKEEHGKRGRTHVSHGRNDNALVSILHDSTLDAGGYADAVVSIGGSSTARGKVGDAVVSVFGSSTSSGEVGNAVVSVAGDTRVEGGSVDDAAVAVLGNTYVNAPVKGEVVAVLGDVELGPKAEVGGDLVCVGGSVIRDPKAVVHGQVNNVAIGGHLGGGNFNGLHAWLRHCLLLGRPLAFGANLGWAWMIALGALAVYAVIALLFPRGVERCVETFEQRTGSSILTALVVTLLTPLAAILLIVTVVGAPALMMFLFIAKLFGKAVMLAWIGRLITKPALAGKPVAPALSVLVGGVVVLLVYTVPVIGFVVAALLTWLGLGTVVYTLILGSKRNKAAARASAAAAASSRAASMPVMPPPSTQPPVMPMSVPPAATGETPGVVTEPMPVATPSPMSSAGFTGAVPPAAQPANPVEPPMANVPPPSMPVVSPAATLPRAGFWIRMAASALDLVLVGMATRFTLNIGFQQFMLVYAAYNTVLWVLKGTTVGGIVCGLKVVRLDDRPLDWSTAIVRALGSFLSFFVAGLGFIWVAFDDAKQSWHDKIAGTTVVHVPRGGSLV